MSMDDMPQRIERGTELDSDMIGIKELFEEAGYTCELGAVLMYGRELNVTYVKDGEEYTATLAHVRENLIGIRYLKGRMPMPAGLKAFPVGEGQFTHGIELD